MKIISLIVLFSISLFAMSDKELANAINLAGKQRMLTQKMSKEALLIFIGIEPQKSAKNLKLTSALFDKTLSGLISGDKELSLVLSGDKVIDKKLKEVQKLWTPFYKQVRDVANLKKREGKTFAYIDKNNTPLLKKMNEVVTLYTKLGSSGISKLKMANDINLAGKLRMLTQKIAKDLLLYQSEVETKNSLSDLKSSIALFDKIINGLYGGDKELNLQGTKLPKILKQLDIAKKSWQELKPLIPKALKEKSNQELTKELISELDKTKFEVNRAVELYAKSLNRQKQVMKLNALISGFMTKKDNSKYLINLAGKQRMLTQRISKLAIECKDNLIDKSCNNLEKYINLYDKTLNGFKNGDKELNLSALKSQDALKQVAMLKEIWKPFKSSAISLKNSKGKDTKALDYILKNNEKLLSESNKLVTILEKDSSKNVSYIEKAQLNIVNIAGRQRMLTQKMTKEFLEYVQLKNQDAKLKKNKTVKLFEQSLKALVDGNKEMSLPKVTNPKIKEQLIKVSKIWGRIMTIYNKNSLNQKEMVLLLKVNPILLKEMNQAVQIIEKSTDY